MREINSTIQNIGEDLKKSEGGRHVRVEADGVMIFEALCDDFHVSFIEKFLKSITKNNKVPVSQANFNKSRQQ